MISWITTIILVVFGIAAIVLPIALSYWLYRKLKRLIKTLAKGVEQLGETLQNLENLPAGNQDWHRPGLLAEGTVEKAKQIRQKNTQARWQRRHDRAHKARTRWAKYGLIELK